RDEIERRLAGVQRKLKEREQQQQASGRLTAFRKHYNSALFYQTLFTGLDRAENRRKSRSAAQFALALFGLDGDERADVRVLTLLARDRDYHPPAEQDRLANACYELLLILAENEASTKSAMWLARADQL